MTKSYHALRDAAVDRFLALHPELDKLLGEAYQQIQAYFPDSPCRLEVYTDPETTERQLLILIQTQSDFEAAMDRLYQFRDAWWLDNLHRARSKLSIDVEFV